MMKWRFITGSKPEVKPRVRPRMLDERQELVGADPLPDITPAGEVALPCVSVRSYGICERQEEADIAYAGLKHEQLPK